MQLKKNKESDCNTEPSSPFFVYFYTLLVVISTYISPIDAKGNEISLEAI